MLNPGTKLLQHCTSSSDHIGQVSDSHDSFEGRNYDSRARKTAQNYKKYNSWNGMEVRFAPETKADDVDDSGICSPPLWTTSPPRSPQHRANHYRSLSPTSRTQAIVRGQKELMEMVRNMPEACYELSLKDLVEQPFVEARQESVPEERALCLSNEVLYRRENSKKMTDKRVQGRRSGGIDSGGLYLKMGFPVSLGSRKSKKKNETVINTSAKVSPKPPVTDGSAAAKGVDKDWWKKSFSVNGESESGGSSINSGSMKSSGSSSSTSSSSSRRSRSSSRRHGSGGCWSFFCIKKSKVRTRSD